MANNLIVDNISAGYGAIRVLHGVSVSLEEGETVVLLGTNGNGKSTLMKCIMGMVRPDVGDLYFESAGNRTDLTGDIFYHIRTNAKTLIPHQSLAAQFDGHSSVSGSAHRSSLLSLMVYSVYGNQLVDRIYDSPIW